MALFYLVLALLAQTLLAADEKVKNVVTVTEPEINAEVVEDVKNAKVDWIDMLSAGGFPFTPTSSLAMVSKSLEDDAKTAEEKITEMKNLINSITAMLESDLTGLLKETMKITSKSEEEDNTVREKRSSETPMDSSKVIMRLLRHIKTNNDYQNIAIEKMMTAQEIADKFNIEFTPDPEVLTDFAVAANEQSKELSAIVQDAYALKNVSQTTEFVPLEMEAQSSPAHNEYYSYVHEPHQPAETHHHHSQSAHHNHVQYSEPYSQYYYNYPAYESQVASPAYSSPVTQKPTFYDTVMVPEYSYCSMEPMTTTTTILLPAEEPVETEPELVGEEYEETVSSKVFVQRDEEPGSATVNHVTSYSFSEKSHFKTPEIEKLPEQMQYYFFLV